MGIPESADIGITAKICGFFSEGMGIHEKDWVHPVNEITVGILFRLFWETCPGERRTERFLFYEFENDVRSL